MTNSGLKRRSSTYVTYDGDPRVYFFSLDAPTVLGVAGARLLHHSATLEPDRWLSTQRMRWGTSGSYRNVTLSPSLSPNGVACALKLKTAGFDTQMLTTNHGG